MVAFHDISRNNFASLKRHELKYCRQGSEFTWGPPDAATLSTVVIADIRLAGLQSKQAESLPRDIIEERSKHIVDQKVRVLIPWLEGLNCP